MTTLEKIRSEIEETQKNTIDWSRSAGLIDALEIIDKYAEQEPNIDMECDEIKILQKRSYLEGFHEAHKMLVEQEPCDDCDYSEIMDWEQDAKTGKAKPIYWCERHKEPCDDAVSRQAVLKIIDGWYEQNRDTENIEDLIVLITYMDSVRPQ